MKVVMGGSPYIWVKTVFCVLLTVGYWAVN